MKTTERAIGLVFVVAMVLVCASSFVFLNMKSSRLSVSYKEMYSVPILRTDTGYNPPADFHPQKLYGSILDSKSTATDNSSPKSQPHNFTVIPNLVHITISNKTKVNDLISTWVTLNPDFNVIVYDDSDISTFVNDISQFNPNILTTFEKLATMVEKTDYWRYLIMYYYGGIYVDSDVQDIVSIDSWPYWKEGVKAIAGLEGVVHHKDISAHRYSHSYQYEQFMLCGVKRHDLFRIAVQNVGENVEREALHKYPSTMDTLYQIIFRTGPGAWTDAVHEYFRLHNYRDHQVSPNNVIGDVIVAGEEWARGKWASHHYHGSWKQQKKD